MAAAGILALANLLGTGLRIYGSLRQAEETQRILGQNAQLARYAANDAIRRGAYEVFKRRLDASRQIGAQKVAMAEGGVSVQGGSAELLEFDARLAADLDAAVLSNNAAREAWGMELEATEYERAAKRAKKDAVLGALTGAVSGGISAYQTYKSGGG